MYYKFNRAIVLSRLILPFNEILDTSQEFNLFSIPQTVDSNVKGYLIPLFDIQMPKCFIEPLLVSTLILILYEFISKACNFDRFRIALLALK